MPLRDHFRSPNEDRIAWEGFHAQWTSMIVVALNQLLPSRYVASPRVRLGTLTEIDVAALDDERRISGWEGAEGGGLATASWAPPTLTVEADLPKLYEYEVQVHDVEHGRRIVAAVELVSPGNKDRPEHRRAFVAKCAALLQQGVSVCLVDLVTTRRFNLYLELLDLVGKTDPAFAKDSPPIYAAACRSVLRDEVGYLETWAHPLRVGAPLPTLPLWLANDLALSLELEATYEETCRTLRIP